jgi:hypothetical protein
MMRRRALVVVILIFVLFVGWKVYQGLSGRGQTNGGVSPNTNSAVIGNEVGVSSPVAVNVQEIKKPEKNKKEKAAAGSDNPLSALTGSMSGGSGSKKKGESPGIQGTGASLMPAQPVVEIHKELIPKDIAIVRVYYAQPLMAPGDRVEFDINGSGFTPEFQKMITVESGNQDVGIKNLVLVTPNQIHGTLVVSSVADTGVIFPQVLIQGKVVFRAPEPYAVIRPGDVLNVAFTEMGDNGRSGRFRVYTNLTQEMYETFEVLASTPSIVIADLTPTPPFIVDATVQIGPAVQGSYGLTILIEGKTVWKKDGAIRIIQPNVGDSGLVQRVRAVDGYFRPGDAGHFIVQGSGFQPRDTELLKVRVKEWESVKSSFTFVAPGRMELVVFIPATAAPMNYSLSILQDQKSLLDVPDAFQVVGKNWVRGFGLSPALVSGSESQVILQGRDLQKEFVDSLVAELDVPDLVIGKFQWVNAEQATASIKAGAQVAPGDYLLTLTSQGAPVKAQFGNILTVGGSRK